MAYRIPRAGVLIGFIALLGLAGPALAQDGYVVQDFERAYLEGELGETRGYPMDAELDDGIAVVPDPELCPEADKVAYRFAGVSDDGQKGAATRKEATSIHCSSIDPSLNVRIKIQLSQWSGALEYEGCVTAAPHASFTFSTQNTTIYFDDVIFGEGGGTNSIFQGSGVVLINQGDVTCSAQTLDPLGYPPVFAVNLPLWGACGYRRDLVLLARTATGVQEFTACRRITARGAFTVGAGAHVNFRAGDEIVLGDGFSVATNGSFTAAIDPSLPSQ